MILVEVPFNPFVDIGQVLSGVPYEGAEIIEGNIRKLMELPKHGNPYKHQDGTVRPASAEGEAAGIDSKDLVGSYESIELSLVEAYVYSEIADIGHGGYLEEKRDRPVTMPAVEMSEPEIEKLVKERLKEGLSAD